MGRDVKLLVGCVLIGAGLSLPAAWAFVQVMT